MRCAVSDIPLCFPGELAVPRDYEVAFNPKEWAATRLCWDTSAALCGQL